MIRRKIFFHVKPDFMLLFEWDVFARIKFGQQSKIEGQNHPMDCHPKLQALFLFKKINNSQKNWTRFTRRRETNTEHC